jgi:hypothetical protein
MSLALNGFALNVTIGSTAKKSLNLPGAFQDGLHKISVVLNDDTLGMGEITCNMRQF